MHFKKRAIQPKWCYRYDQLAVELVRLVDQTERLYQTQLVHKLVFEQVRVVRERRHDCVQCNGQL